jgi:hypothetical protein
MRATHWEMLEDGSGQSARTFDRRTPERPTMTRSPKGSVTNFSEGLAVVTTSDTLVIGNSTAQQ